MKATIPLRQVLSCLSEADWSQTIDGVPNWLSNSGVRSFGQFAQKGETGAGGRLFHLFPEDAELSQLIAIPSISFEDGTLRSVVFRISNCEDLDESVYKRLVFDLLNSLQEEFGAPEVRNV